MSFDRIFYRVERFQPPRGNNSGLWKQFHAFALEDRARIMADELGGRTRIMRVTEEVVYEKGAPDEPGDQAPSTA